MKIRTDFVTNSSSSSFVVEINVKAMDGTEFSMAVNPDDGGGNGDADIICSADDVVKCNSLEELVQLMNDKIVVNEPEEDADYFKKSVADFFNNVSENIESLDEIDAITFRRIWYAWGEAASCFGWNLEFFAEELPELAEKVCELGGEEKEKAKEDLKKYLSNYKGNIEGEWGGYFPSEFMGAKGNASIVWDALTDNIEAFAEMVASEELPNDDYAVETTVIEFKSKNITQTAEYILGGEPTEEWDEEDEW